MIREFLEDITKGLTYATGAIAAVQLSLIMHGTSIERVLDVLGVR